MHREPLILAMLVLTTAAAPAPAPAASPWLAATAGHADYAMDEFLGPTYEYRNRYPRAFAPGTLDGGFSFTAAAGADLGRHWSLAVEYERVDASTFSLAGSPYVEADLPVHLFKLEPAWYPLAGTRARAGLGAGAGVAFLSGFLHSDYGDPYNGDISATTWAADARLIGEFSPVRALWLTAAAGWRALTFDEVIFGHTLMADPDSGELKPLTYGGWYLRAGLRWELPGGDR
ncbi:MAG: hypothetical protein R6X35_03365 [Candidatus Krumholzibacteriia bacterium]